LAKRNKPSKKQITIIKADKNKELSLLERNLLNFAKKGQPVLLYGKDNDGREGMIKKIHKLNGGIDCCWEYVGTDGNIESMDELQNKILSAYRSDNHKKAEKLLKDYNNTVKTYRHIDFDLDGGEEVSNKLAMFNFICSYLGYGGGVLVESDCYGYYDFSENSILVGESAIYNHDVGTEECLHIIDRKGLLFIDNIQCEYKDNEWYKKLSIKIEKRRHRDSTLNSGNWLIAYTYDYTTFPKQFLDQFELVSLDSEDYEVNEQEEEREAIGTPVRKEELTPFSHSGTKWSDVKMCLIDEDHFKIIIKDGQQKTVTYSQMGFKHKSSTKKNKLWEVLLRFAINNSSPVEYYSNRTEVEKDIQRLNNVLRKYFGITERPIRYQKDKKGYVAGFMISDSSHLKEHMDSMRQTISEEEILDKETDNGFS